MKTFTIAMLATAAVVAAPGNAAIVQSVSYSTLNGGGNNTFQAYAGPANQLAAVTFNLGITYGETDTLFTYPGSPAYSGTASGTAGFAISNGFGASTPFTPTTFTCAAGASTCGASLSTNLVAGVPNTSLAAFIGSGTLSLTSQGSIGLAYDTPAPVTGSTGTARISGTVTYTLLSDVPEPASWAMMIGGFAMTGVAMRRRPRIDAAIVWAHTA